MGLRNSKSKKSYEVASAGDLNQKKASINSSGSSNAVIEGSTTTADPPPPPSPIIEEPNLGPEWLNQTQFEELLSANVDQFSKIVGFRVKPAMAPGENYATLMLRISIDVELTDKSTKLVCFMLKVPHNTPQMEQMLAMANFFNSENKVYSDILPKLEELYKAKGLDINFAPKAFKLDSEKEPKLGNTVLMNDLSQEGFKNLNRLECLNLEQTKFALKKLAQFHAASAMNVQVNGPYADQFVNGIMGGNKDVLMAFYEGIIASFRTAFMANLKNFKNGEEFREKLEKAFVQIFLDFEHLMKADPDEFNVLNHGDCWMNNLLFKLDSKGKVEDMLFVDFQNPKYGSPTQDLFYLILTSVHIDYKLDYFEYFIRHYHEQLTKHLDLLGFTGKQPSLRELHMQMYKYGSWAVFPSISVLPIVLLDPNESATFENFLGDSESGAKFKNLLYANKRYHGYIEKLLPWLDNKGFLEAYFINQVVAPETPSSEQPDNPNQILDWLNVSDIAEVISSAEPEFEKIVGGSWSSATKPGDNFASKLLKIDIETQLKDNTSKTLSYILKVMPQSTPDNFTDVNMFPKEREMYRKYIPAFEQLYKDAGLTVTFTANSFVLNKPIKEEYLLMENLLTKGFKMADRKKGLNMEHTKSSLKKLAQWHAASIKYKELNGAYPPLYNDGIYIEQTRDLFHNMFASAKEAYIRIFGTFEGADEYLPKLEWIIDNHVDQVLEDAKINEQAFNVLNHGDAWINNIMFQYDAEGRLKETYLLDHQNAKYGNPAQDLYYFLISSAELDIKVDEFDNLIRFYHENLVEHTKLLKYNGFVPSLSELHTILIEHPAFAVGTVISTLTVCLTDEGFNPELFFVETPESEAFRSKLFGNERYKAHVEKIMPWLNRRGLLDP
ncbi:GM26081 [Drosophila sechellia]|uniref:GM26081 n=3 Tax=Drosophila sechellia TaxID=7238 RepID=B4HHY9_DROSE|nr:GM26081 [Drosophila sechellia]